MNAERWRCFVAAPISEELRADLSDAVDAWPVLDGLRWTDPEAWHVTAAFIGSVDAGLVPQLAARVKAVAARHEPMTLVTGGLGAFPSPARARVAWYGIDDANGRMARLAADVAQAVGLEPAQSYRPHLTLARVRSEPLDLRDFLVAESAPEGELKVGRVDLMWSHLGRGPVRYETLSSAPLGGVPEHG